MMKGTKPDPFDEIKSMHERAQRMAREYEDAKKDGNYDMQCPYPEIIEIYDRIMELIVDWDGWGSIQTITIRSMRQATSTSNRNS
jgi:hypothetical protein